MKIFTVGVVFIGLLGWGIHRETLTQERTMQQQIAVICPVYRAKTVPLDAKAQETLRKVCPDA